jgi:hypothetical protein
VSAPIGFTVVFPDLEVLLACDACGACVRREDRPRHEGWHESLARTARQADSADGWTRPIGGAL